MMDVIKRKFKINDADCYTNCVEIYVGRNKYKYFFTML